MSRLAWMLLALATMAASVSAQVVPAEGGTAFHFGDLPDGRATWMTAGHGIKLGQRIMLNINGRTVASEVIEHSTDPDLAMLATPVGTPTEPRILIGHEDAEPGEEAILVGFGSQTVRRRMRVSTTYRMQSRTVWDQRAYQGDSGGPLLIDGVCYGVLIETSENLAYSVPVSACRQWIASTGRWQLRGPPSLVVPLPLPYLASPCPNGQCPRPPVNQQPSVSRCSCQAEIALLRSRIAALESRQAIPGPIGPQGPSGRDGIDGQSATPIQIGNAVAAHMRTNPPSIKVVIEDNGKPIYTNPDVRAGSTIRVPIQRTEVTSGGE